MALIGNIEHFKGNADDFTSYLERIEHLFRVNVVEDPLKVSMFITLSGPQVYNTLKNLVAPRSPGDLQYNEIKEILTKHYSPPVSEIGERFKFNKCCQKPGQSIADYVVEIRKLAAACKFGNFLEEALRDRLVCGVLSEAIQKRLLSEATLTFEKACNTAISFELADRQAKMLGGEGSVNKIGHKYWQKPKSQSKNMSSGKHEKEGNSKVPSNSQNEARGNCFRCGRQHSHATCPAVNWECFTCRRKGHTSRMCRNKSVKVVNEEESSEQEGNNEQHEDLYPLLSIFSINRDVSHRISCRIENLNIDFEIDTGACKSVISEIDYKRYFSNRKLCPITYKLNVVTGAVIKVLGEIFVNVSMGRGAQQKLPLTVIKSCQNFAPLLGRNWLNALSPGWQDKFNKSLSEPKINQISVSDQEVKDHIRGLQSKYKDLFDNNLSSAIEGFDVSLNMREGFGPVFKKAYNLPYALRPKVEQRLNKMVQAGILIPTKVSSWASPIVIAEKKRRRHTYMC